MQVVLDVKEDKLEVFLTIVKNLKNDLVQNIKVIDNTMSIEPIEKNSKEYEELQKIKSKNNPKFSLNEAKEILGL